MGKSYRNVYAGSNSVSYKTPHNRGFAKVKKRYTHKAIRTHNKCCGEDDMISLKYFHDRKIMKNGNGSGYYGELGNIPNKPGFNFYDKSLRFYNLNWEKDLNDLDLINREIINNNYNCDEYKICKKQIERRGCIGLFNGYR